MPQTTTAEIAITKVIRGLIVMLGRPRIRTPRP
jgi:hypothetical protein